MLTVFKNEVAPCIPPEYGTLAIFVSTLENKIGPAVAHLIERNLSRLEVSDLLRLVDWLVYFNAQMTVFDCGDRAVCERFSLLATELMHEYLARIKQQVLGWFENIKKQQVRSVRIVLVLVLVLALVYSVQCVVRST